jgi:3-dehydrosphinganine reductase
MGRGVAKLLASKGANVIIVARDQKKLDDAIAYISVTAPVPPIHNEKDLIEFQTAAKSPSTQRFHTISADLSSASENERILIEAIAWNNGQSPDIVWTCVGVAKPSLFLDAPLETHRMHMEVNYWSTCYLAHTVLKSWLQPSSSQAKPSSDTEKKEQLPRHFIMTSSVVAFCGVAGYSPYSPSKSALRSLADTLRSELNLYNGSRLHASSPLYGSPETKIHIVLPGTITSPGFVEENKTKHPVTHLLEEGDPVQNEDEVAVASVNALENGSYMITTQMLSHAMRVSSLGGSPRNGLFGIRDMVFSWLTAIAWLFIGPDMESKVYQFGKKNGVMSGATKQ